MNYGQKDGCACCPCIVIIACREAVGRLFETGAQTFRQFAAAAAEGEDIVVDAFVALPETDCDILSRGFEDGLEV